MCLSTIYRVSGPDNRREVIAKEIAAVTRRGEKLVFTDIMGIPTEVEGSIEQVDLMDNYILVRTD